MWETRIDRSEAWRPWPWPLSLSWPSPGRRPFSALALLAAQLPKDWLGIISAGLLYVFCKHNQQTSSCCGLASLHIDNIKLTTCPNSGTDIVLRHSSVSSQPTLFWTKSKHKPGARTWKPAEIYKSQVAQFASICGQFF